MATPRPRAPLGNAAAQSLPPHLPTSARTPLRFTLTSLLLVPNPFHCRTDLSQLRPLRSSHQLLGGSEQDCHTGGKSQSAAELQLHTTHTTLGRSVACSQKPPNSLVPTSDGSSSGTRLIHPKPATPPVSAPLHHGHQQSSDRVATCLLSAVRDNTELISGRAPSVQFKTSRKRLSEMNEQCKCWCDALFFNHSK